MEGLSYLNGKPWSGITREERYFCAELFFEIKKDPIKFIKFLNEHKIFELNPEQEWEIGFEVCFYRDFLYSIDRRVKKEFNGIKYPQKRTFDLCLFSENEIIVIEAKAHEKFDEKQLKSLFKDVVEKRLLEVLPSSMKLPNLFGLLLYSTKRGLPNNKLTEHFGKITWSGLYTFYKNRAFLNAEDVVKK